MLADLDGQPLVGHVFGTLCNRPSIWIGDWPWFPTRVQLRLRVIMASSRSLSRLDVSSPRRPGIAAPCTGLHTHAVAARRHALHRSRQPSRYSCKGSACLNAPFMGRSSFRLRFPRAMELGPYRNFGQQGRICPPAAGRRQSEATTTPELRDIDTTGDLADAHQNR